MASKKPKVEASDNGFSHLIPNPQWRTAITESDLKRVLVKETAAKHALKSMTDILQTLKMHVNLNPSSNNRIDKIETIIKRKKEFQVFIGFQGSSGAGKSTLINALIGFAKLLPSSAERACTAVPVEVSYNKSNDPDSKFILKVLYITKDEWRTELDLLFEAIAAQEIGNGEDDEADTERGAFIDETMDKVKHLYGSEIRSLDKLKTFTVEKLLSHTVVRNILGSTEEIRTSDKADFTRNLLNHIDSGGGNQSAPSWPLVKLVKVFVKSQILEHGLTLVDLPGVGDVSLARSSVAENYQSKLSVTCILADARRGITEKNAHDLLEKVTQRNLQLDGLYNSKSLCFILSQIDRSFDLIEYLETHPDVRAQNEQDLNIFIAANERIAALTTQRYKATTTKIENRRVAKEKYKKIQEIKQWLDSNPSPLNIPLHHKEIENEETDLSQLRILVRKEMEAIEKLSKRISSNETAAFHARSRLRSACIRNRNQLCANNITRDYEENLAQMGQKQTSQLQVFCVAATLYLKYKTTSKRAAGFPNREDTGIQELRDWLVATTFEDRESIAQAFLQDAEAFLDSNASWIHDKYGDPKMSVEMREIWEPQLNFKFRSLEKELLELRLASSEAFKNLIHKNLYSAIPRSVDVAASFAEKQVKEFAQGIIWSTHRCVNKNHGHWTDSKKRKHRWNEKLAADLKGAIVSHWNKTFLEYVPIEQDTFVTKGKKLISDFAMIVGENKFFVEVAPGLSTLQDFILRDADLLQTQSKNAFGDITEAYRKSHRCIPPAIKKFLTPMYDECGGAKGTGLYAANKALHVKWMRTKGQKMYLRASKAVVEVVDEMLANLPQTLETAYRASLEDIQEQITRFFDENTANGLRTSGRMVVSIAKVNLQKALLGHIDDLAAAWTSCNGAQKVIEEDDDDDAIMFDTGDLFDVDGKDDDDDYEDGSDQDNR